MSHEHITTEEMQRDIADTEAEIATMERELEGLRLMSDRWSQMRADYRVTGIRERREFIAKVRTIIESRKPVTQ